MMHEFDLEPPRRIIGIVADSRDNGLNAVWIPAARAGRVDPATALRGQ